MIRQAKFIFILILMIITPYCISQDQVETEDQANIEDQVETEDRANVEDQANIKDQVAFKTIHVFNLRSKYTADEMKIILEKFNSLFIKLGHPECRYRVWEITEDKNHPSYLWESNWTSRIVYEEIHKNEEYRKLIREDFVGLRMMFKDHSYYRYYELPF